MADVVAARAMAEAAEVRVLCDAAHWADLHGRLAEFAPAEFGAVPGTTEHLPAPEPASRDH